MPQARPNTGQSPDKQDAYLKHPGASLPMVIGIAVFLIAGLICWGVLGTHARYATGPYYGVGRVAICFIPVEEAGLVEVGDSIWVGNDQGALNAIDTENALTAAQIVAITPSLATLGWDKDESYYQAYVEFSEVVALQGTYRIVYGTASPFEDLFGGA